jgi:hypothetical protein
MTGDRLRAVSRCTATLVVAAVVVWSLVQYQLNARALAELEARLGRSE